MKTQHLLTSLVLAAALASAGCSEWKQDPLAGREAALNNGSEKPEQPGGKPTPSNAIMVDADNYFSCKEGRTDEMQISARILLPGYSHSISIENLDEFPGATFDANTGKFKWTPARGTVIGEEMTSEKILKVSVVASKPGAPVLVGGKEIVIGIARAFTAPEVVTIRANKQKLREGESDTVTVTVRDADAVKEIESTWPTIQFTNVIGGKSLVPFVSLIDTAWKNNLIEYTMRVDLTDAELTKAVSDYSFGVKANSRFAQTSDEKRVDYSVMTSLTDAVTTWVAEQEGTPGKVIEYQFMVYDPKGEAAVTVTSFQNLPVGALASCTKVNASNLSCTFLWKTDATTPVNNYNIIAKVEVRNSDFNKDNFIKTQNLSLKVKIKPVASPSPFQISGGR